MLWIPALTTVALALIAAFNPFITDAISNNPTISVVLGALIAILSALAKSPISK